MNQNEVSKEEVRMPATRVILASASKNRQALLSSFGIPFDIVPANIDEEAIKDPDPVIRAKKIAAAKARFVASSHHGLIVAADTFSFMNNVYFQKPKHLDDARKMLRTLCGNTMRTITGVCVINTQKNQEKTVHREVKIHCKDLTAKEIEEYVTKKPVTEWAAAYNPLDEMSVQIFSPVGEYPYRIEYNGLPVDVVSEALEGIGYRIDTSIFKSTT